jgi:integrase
MNSSKHGGEKHMPSIRIAKRTVEEIVPQNRDAYLWDTDLSGFGVKISPKGARIYLVQYRAGGRKAPTRRVTIGRHGSPWTADQARQEAKRILGLVATDHDPAEDKAKVRKDLNVGELCDLYLNEGCHTKKASTIATDKGRIERHIKPLLGKKRLGAITKADIQRFMNDVAAGKTAANIKTGPRGRAIVEGGKGTATRTLGLLGGIFSFAVDRGMRQDNPVRGIKRFADKKNERFLSPEELARLGKVLQKALEDGENATAIAAIRLLILTGCRKSEILGLKREWIDWERGYLRLPDSKTGAKIVPMGAPALELLASLPVIEGNPYVLPSLPREGHYVGLPKVWEKIREKAELGDVRLHDLRHSFASTAAASGDSLIVIGALLGHKDTATTSRYAHLTNDALRMAATRTANHIAAAMGDKPDKATIVSLRPKQHEV